MIVRIRWRKGVIKGWIQSGRETSYIGGVLSLNFLSGLWVSSQSGLSLVGGQVAVLWIFALSLLSCSFCFVFCFLWLQMDPSLRDSNCCPFYINPFISYVEIRGV